MIVSERLDPHKLNRGQLIHEKGSSLETDPLRLKGLRSILDVEKDYNSIVEKKEVDNVLFVDWFEVTITLPFVPDQSQDNVQLNEFVRLENLNSSTRLYSTKWNLFYMGKSVGTLMTNPNNSNHNRAQFKIQNISLYEFDWLDTYKEIYSLLRWNHVSLTRLDIAIDGKAAFKALKLAKRHLTGRVVGRKGKATFSAKYSSSKEITSFHVGSSKSDKSATIYNKSKEILNSEKGYISLAWKSNGLNTDETVNRFEIRLKSKVTKSYDWTKLDDLEYLASIFRTETKNWFEFYYTGKDKNKYRTYKNNTMEWIKWESVEGKLLQKNEAISVTGVHRAKRLIKDSLYMETVKSLPANRDVIYKLLNEYSLHKWFDDRIDNWLNEWDKEKKINQLNSN